MTVAITPNLVVCPHCDTQFENNRVNGMALLEVVQMLEAKKRMHCRLTLNTLEMEFPDRKLPPAIKKAVLDGYNDLARSLHTALGFGLESE